MSATTIEASDRRGAHESGVMYRGRAFLRRHLRWLGWLPLALLPLGCGLAAIAIGQDADYDLLNYHYYDAYAFLHHRLGSDVFVATGQTTLDPLLDLPTYFLINHVPPRVEGFVLGFVQGLSLVVVYFIARRLRLSRPLSYLAALAGGVAGGFASELGTAMQDSVVSLPLLLAVWCALVAIDRQGSARELAQASRPGAGGEEVLLAVRRLGPPGWWLLSGLLAGLGTGLKLAEVATGVACVAGAVVSVRGWADRLRSIAASVAGFAVGVLGAFGWWGWYLWRHFHNPLMFDPAANSIFHSRYYPPSVASLVDQRFLPPNLTTFLIYPIYWVLHPTAVAEIPIRELSIPIAYVGLVVLAVAGGLRLLQRALSRARDSARSEDIKPASTAPAHAAAHHENPVVTAQHDRYLVAVLVVSLVIWAHVFGIYRYLIPVELLAPVVIFAIGRRLAYLVARLAGRRRPALRVTFGVCCVLLVGSMASANPSIYWGRVPWGKSFFSLSTPQVLNNGRTDMVIQVSADPLGFVVPQLPSRVIGVGGIGGLLGPATLAQLHRDEAAVRRAHGVIAVDFEGVFVSPTAPALPAGTAAFLVAMGIPDPRSTACDLESAVVGGAALQVSFCVMANYAR